MGDILLHCLSSGRPGRGVQAGRVPDVDVPGAVEIVAVLGCQADVTLSPAAGAEPVDFAHPNFSMLPKKEGGPSASSSSSSSSSVTLESSRRACCT